MFIKFLTCFISFLKKKNKNFQNYFEITRYIFFSSPLGAPKLHFWP